MKATALLKKLRPQRLFDRHHQRHATFVHWDERINPRGVLISEDEVRHHHRLEAQSEAQRLAN